MEDGDGHGGSITEEVLCGPHLEGVLAGQAPSSSACMPVSPLVHELLKGPAVFICVCVVRSGARAGAPVEGTVWNL